MTTLMQDLEIAQRIAGAMMPAIPSEISSDGLYLNFAYYTAVVIEPQITEEGKLWNAAAYAWDRTGGVSAHAEVYTGFELVLALWHSKQLIDRELEAERKLEALLEESYGPGE